MKSLPFARLPKGRQIQATRPNPKSHRSFRKFFRRDAVWAQFFAWQDLAPGERPANYWRVFDYLQGCNERDARRTKMHLAILEGRAQA